MDLSIPKYLLSDEHGDKISVTVSNPTEVKTTFSSFTTYNISGTDRNGQFQCSRRYSEFDLIRQTLLTRWPGCYIPALPEKKMVGNSDAIFVNNRKQGLEVFCQEMSCLPHLWYSDEFEIFIRKSGDVESNLKSLAAQTHEDILKKYDEKLSRLRGKSIDTNLIAKVLQFNKYLRKVQPLLTVHNAITQHFKQFLVQFCQAKKNNMDQFTVIYNYLLPEYEKICLNNYLDDNVSGKLIFSDEQDEKLGSFVNKIKQIIALNNFDQLLFQVDREEREISAFLDVYKQHAIYDKKVNELKEKQKDLEIQQQKLNMGKQGLLKSIFKSNIEEDKRTKERQISVNKDLITTYGLLSDLITMLLGFYQIDRFREAKMQAHIKTIKEVAKIQVKLASLQKQLCNHILDNHNLI